MRMIFQFVNKWTFLYHYKLIRRYKLSFGVWPNIALPASFSEKILWRKIFDHNPQFVTLSDKLKAKTHFRKHCPNLNIIEPLWVGKRPEELDEQYLQGDCIIKSNCGSSQNIFIRDGKYDRAKISHAINRWLSRRYGVKKGEWAYSGIDFRIYVEPMLKAQINPEVMNLYFETFLGVPRMSIIQSDKQTALRKSGLFDVSGKRLPFSDTRYSASEKQLPSDFRVPPVFFEAAEHSRKLAADLDYCRVDFMFVDDILYGLEMSFYPVSGLRKYTDPTVSRQMGDYWNLEKSWFLNTLQSGWRKTYANALQTELGAISNK
jgi:hypothetical protein